MCAMDFEEEGRYEGLGSPEENEKRFGGLQLATVIAPSASPLTPCNIEIPAGMPATYDVFERFLHNGERKYFPLATSVSLTEALNTASIREKGSEGTVQTIQSDVPINIHTALGYGS